MGFFNKMFGSKDSVDTAVAESREVDFITALGMHLRGEIEPALRAYLEISEEPPYDNLSPFFAAAVLAGNGQVADAVERLRTLSRRISLRGETISFAVTRDIFALFENEPTLKMPAVGEIIVSFGDRLKGEGLLRESATCFEIAAGLLRENAHLLHKLGDTLHDLRLYDYAESVLKKALEYAPNHWGALYTYAVLLQDLGRFAEALPLYEKALKINPDHVKCRNNYGAALMMTNRLDEALEQCTTAAELDPAFPFARVNLGNIQLLMKNYAAARTFFTEAISLDKNIAPAYFGLASVEDSLGSDTERVGELYRTAIELNPSIPEIHQALGNLLAREGNPEALSCFNAAAGLNSRLKNLHTDFANACLKLGRREEAIEHLRTALQQNPDDAVAKGILSRAEEGP